jgi:preprotein translocase subunit SecF
MKLYTFLVAAAILVLSGCSITQEYHFNNDFSGTYKFEMNMGDMISMLQSMDTTGSINSLDTLDQSFDQIRNQYNDAGAKDVEVGWKNDKKTIYISFGFDNLEKLNEILSNSNNEFNLYTTGSQDEKASFTKKGKSTLIMNFPETSKDTAIISSIEGMKDYLTIETIFSFDRAIKSINNRSGKISEDRKSVKFEGKVDDLIKEGYTMDSQIKLKRK